MKTFWLSFADDRRPKGHQFLGVAVVDVSVEEAADMFEEVRLRFPRARPGAEWIAAATRKSWVYRCNPGGQIMSIELSPEQAADMPRNRLLTRTELEHFGAMLDGTKQ